MSEAENFPNQEMTINKDLNNSEAKNISGNDQMQSQDKNNIENASFKNDDLKIGQYYLTPLQSILLNKKFPMGFKLETEENILKSIEITKQQEKKQKQAQKLNQQIGRRSSNKFGQQTKRNNKNINNFENIPNNISPEKYQIYKQCKSGFEKIKDSKYFNNYYASDAPDIPCLSAIEKKINNFEYTSLYLFEMDVRNIWGYYFKINPNDDVSKKMSEDWEKICTELENPNSELNVDNIKKRTDNIKKEMEKIKDNKKNTVPPPVKNSEKNSDNNNTPMTVEEKNQLGNYIRSLNKEQLKGIIRILNDSDSYPKTKYFEFDIDKLPTKKLRDLEKYVKECININNKNSKNQNTGNKNQTKENTVNKNNSANNINNNNNAQQNNNLTLNQKNKDTNKKEEEKKENTSAKKSRQNSNKKIEKQEESISSDSISSDSSLSG